MGIHLDDPKRVSEVNVQRKLQVRETGSSFEPVLLGYSLRHENDERPKLVILPA